jgi:hypothetical protein
LLGYISFYARYTYWAGDFAWGDRYVSTSVELVALLAVPLLLRVRYATVQEPDARGLKPTSFLEGPAGAAESRASSKPRGSNHSETSAPSELLLSSGVAKWIWRCGIALIVASLITQLASLAFWVPLEIYQMETLGHPTFVIALRFKNIAAFALGKMDAWGLNNESMTQDPWDYVHITTWNFFPFLLWRVGAVPGWGGKLAFAVWGAGIAALLLVCRRLRGMVEW